MIDAATIIELQRALATASWKLDLWAFADALGADASHDYTKEKFQHFRALSNYSNQFDAETLARILNAVEER